MSEARSSRTLIATPTSSREARLFVAAWLEQQQLTAISERVLLVVSELAANATLHTERPFTVIAFAIDRGVRIEVIDSMPERDPIPVAKNDPAVGVLHLSETGRGLVIVSSVANRWGISFDTNIKTVWCEFTEAEPVGPGEPTIVDGRRPPASADELHAIRFVDLPVVEAIASGLDVEDAIRDLQALPEGAERQEAARLFQLIDETASLRLSGRHAAMHASQLGQTMFEFVVNATDAELLATAELNRALAERPAPTGRTSPTDEVIRFRNWVSEETMRQSKGQPPTRYPRTDEAAVNRDWLWEHAPCGYACAAPDGRLTHVNATLRDWLGLDPMAQPTDFVDLLDEASQALLVDIVRPELRGEGRIENTPMTLLRSDGSRLQVVVSAVYEHDAEGRPSGIRAVVDLAARPTHNEELMLAEQRAGRSETRALELLQALQRTLIPAAPPSVRALDVATSYQPAIGEVGGDFYDVFEVTPDDWCLVIGDVSGKGIEAGIVTAEARHAVRASALHARTPSELLTSLNKALLKQGNTRFCTAALARLQHISDSWIVTLSTGGHPFPLLLRHGTVTRMGKPGSLLGVFDDVSFDDVSIKLASGDALVFYTDGVVEARDESGEFFGDDRMHAALVTAPASAEAIAHAVVDAVNTFQAPGGADDVALVVIRRP